MDSKGIITTIFGNRPFKKINDGGVAVRGLNREKVSSLKNAFVLTQEKKSIFKMKHKQKLMRRLMAFGVIALIILGMMLSAVTSQSASLEASEEKLAEAKQQLAELEQQQKLSEEELERLKDDEYIADLARKDYFLSEEGEIIFNLPETDQKEQEEE
jgi:cell division protein DivIC